MLVDTHAHLDFSQFDGDRDRVIHRALEAGVTAIINVGTDLTTSEESVALALRYPSLHAAVGIHPHDAGQISKQALDRLATMAGEERTVAIGEVGLDFYRDLSPRDQQREAFRRQIRLAIELNMPLVVHDRDAHAEVLTILREEGGHRVGGVLHCFSGNLNMAWQGIEMGFLIALGGPITYSGEKKLEVAREIPLEKILVETDCPFLTPVPHRGERNEPAYVRIVAERIAQVRGTTCEEVAKATTSNAARLFGLKMS
jgi:TatD DNase family protein